MPIRTIDHPGVQINEIPVALSTPPVTGNTVLVTGFAAQGLAKKPYTINTLEDLKAVFGVPTNEPERYFYHTCKEVINNNGNLIAVKLPYDNIMELNYNAVGLKLQASASASTISAIDFDVIDGSYEDVFGGGTTLTAQEFKQDFGGATSLVSGDSNIRKIDILKYCTLTTEHRAQISNANYLAFRSNNYFSSDDVSVSFNEIVPDYIIIDKDKTKVSGYKTNEAKEGIFITVTDVFDALITQQIVDTSNRMDQVEGLIGFDYSTGASVETDWYSNTNNFVRKLEGTINEDSLSYDLMSKFPTLQYGANGVVTDEFNHYVVVHVCKAYQSSNDNGKIDTMILESHIGSLNPSAKDSSTGRNTYICDIVNSNSDYIEMYANYSTVLNTYDWPDTTGFYLTPERPKLLGFDKYDTVKIISDGVIVDSLTDILSKEEISNVENSRIDLVVDAGVSSIAQYISDGSTTYEPTLSNKTITSSSDVGVWSTVCSKYIDFCENIRKDCMAIIDGPRQLVLDAKQPKMIEPLNGETFSTLIGSNLRYLMGVRSSYAAVYINWVEVFDGASGLMFWLPQSAKVVGNYLRNDQIADVWNAPAGVPRGVMNGVVRLSFNPYGKEEDQIYTKGLNYAKFYPSDGFVIEGQKTAQTKPSPVDRVNVRRTLIRLEKFVRGVMHYYRYQQNTITTRRRVINALDPKFREYQIGGGLYDYEIKCDRENNTDAVLRNNELKVDIAVHCTETAEYIIVNFYPVDIGIGFDEVL